MESYFTSTMPNCTLSDVYFTLHTVSENLKEGLEEVVVAKFKAFDWLID